MKKVSYYLKAIEHRVYRKFDNMLSLFTMMDLSRLKPIPYGLTVIDDKYHYYDSDLNPQPFAPGIKADTPLFNYHDEIPTPKGTLPNITEDTITSCGDLYVNAIIAHTAGDRLPYIKGDQLGYLEQRIADILVDDPEEGEALPDNKLSVTEHLTIISDLQTLEELGPFVVTGATERNIVPPKGIEDFKKKLLKKYEGKLDDPIVQVEIVEALQAFDEAWLKDDPSNNIVISGKIKKVARTKSFLITGNSPNFTKEMSANFRMKSFSDGAETDPKQLAIINSSIRYGSYARGTLTAVAGTIAKAFMQIFSPITVEDRDCGTTLTRTTVVTKRVNQFIGRNIIEGGAIIPLTKDNIDGYIGKTVNVRSPSYCKEKNTEICRVCAGENLWRFRESLTQAGTDLANTIIYKVFFSILKGQNMVSVDIHMDDLIK